MAHINIFYYFLFCKERTLQHVPHTWFENHVQGPPKSMVCLGVLAHGLKIICNNLLNHVQ